MIVQFAPSRIHTPNRRSKLLRVLFFAWTLLAASVIGCASAQEKASKHPVDTSDICGHLGEPTFFDAFTDARYVDETGRVRFAAKIYDGRISSIAKSEVPARSDIVDSTSLEKFEGVYKSFCGKPPFFRNEFPYVQKQAAEERERQRVADRKRAEEEKRQQDLAAEETRKKRLEERKRVVHEAIEEQKKVTARLLQLLDEVSVAAKARWKADEAQAAVIPNAIKANYLFSTSFRIKQECDDIQSAGDRPAFQSRRQAEIQSLADQTFRRGQVITFAGVCSLTRSGAGINARLLSPCLASTMSIWSQDKTDQRVLEALELVSERMDKAETFDATVMLSSFVLNSPWPNPCMYGDGVHIKLLSISNVRPKPSPTSETRCVQGDCRNGKSRIDFEDGTIFIGDMKDGKIDGYSAFAFKDKSLTSGLYRSGQSHGIKLARNASGTSGLSLWADDRLLLSATWGGIRWRADGKEFVEQWALRIPPSVESDKARFTYEGETENNIPSGMGVLKDADGKVIFAGRWRDGVPDGSIENK